MIEVRTTETFTAWVAALRDARAKARVLERARRIALGNFGDIAPVGEGVSELRIHYGPGYRVYLVQRGPVVVILLCGGDKASQAADIKQAKQMAKEV